MNYKKLILSFVAVTALAACGGGGDDDNSKDLFSLWKRESDGGPVDLRNADFGVPLMLNGFTDTGGQCQCIMNVIGDQISGKFIINQCRPVTNVSAAQCNEMNNVASYVNQGSVLTVTTQRGETVRLR